MTLTLEYRANKEHLFMHLVNKTTCVIKRKDNIASHILLDKSQVKESNMLVTWVEIAPGGKQALHHHQAEQAYVIIEGEGIMTVGDEEKPIKQGDIAYVPSDFMHGLKNTGEHTLIYVSVATPSFDISEYYNK